MNKKYIFIGSLIFIIICIIMFVLIKNRKNTKIDTYKNTDEDYIEEINYVVNDSGRKYEIRNSEGEILEYCETEEQAQALVEFYKNNPDYRIINPNITSDDIIEIEY